MNRRSLFLSLLLATTACKRTTDTDLPLCKAEVAGSEAQEVAAGDVPADVWFLIVLRNFNRETDELKRPATDCSGRQIAQEPPESYAECMTPDPAPIMLPPRPLQDDDLVIADAGGGKQLVWVQTNHFDNGEALGPIALADLTARGVAIRSLGTLRANPNKIAMRLEPLGAQKVLVTESRVCEPDNPKKCNREMRMLPLVGTKFLEVPLLLETGQCIGPATFQMYREKVVGIPGGLERKFEMSTSVDFSEGSVTVSEQVNIEDSDPDQPDAPPKTFRKANIRRPMTLVQGGITTQPGLWGTMLHEHGSVTVDDEHPRKPDEGDEGEGDEGDES